MLNLNRTNRNALISIFTLIAVIFVIGMLKQSSKYQPKPIVQLSLPMKSLFSIFPTILHVLPVSPRMAALTPRLSLQVDSVAQRLLLPVKLAATRLRMELVDL